MNRNKAYQHKTGGNMKLKIREICNTHRTKYKDHIIKEWQIEKETKDEIFKEAYDSVISLRYCNGYWVEFVNPAIQKEFEEWQKTKVTIEMYYGGATVD